MVRRRLIDRKTINIITILKHRAKPTGFLLGIGPVHSRFGLHQILETGVKTQNSATNGRKCVLFPPQVPAEARRNLAESFLTGSFASRGAAKAVTLFPRRKRRVDFNSRAFCRVGRYAERSLS